MRIYEGKSNIIGTNLTSRRRARKRKVHILFVNESPTKHGNSAPLEALSAGNLVSYGRLNFAWIEHIPQVIRHIGPVFRVPHERAIDTPLEGDTERDETQREFSLSTFTYLARLLAIIQIQTSSPIGSRCISKRDTIMRR